MILNLSAIRGWIINLFFPAKCVTCGVEGSILCDGCFSGIERTCERIDVPYLDGVFSIYRYEKRGALQKSVKAMKYRFVRDVAGFFRDDIERLLNNKFDHSYLVVPVPLHKKREKWRGFNQANELIRGIHWPRFDGLLRVRNTDPQADLNRASRLENLHDAFVATTEVVNKKFVLIDDVCTTGATLSECARVLKEGGAREVYGVVLGHG